MSQQELSNETQEIWALFRETNKQIREVVKHQREQPYTIFIENLRHPPYRLRHPIPILIERDDEKVYATYHDLDMQGTGGNVSEALDDLCAGIIQYYEALKDNVSIVGEQSGISSQKYAHLKSIIELEAQSAETNPWLKIRGIFADDPNFDEFIEGIKARREELDAEGTNE